MAKVLNGEVEVGHRIAYAVRDGNCAAIRLAEVVEVKAYQYHGWNREERAYGDWTGYKLKVKVTQGTPYSSTQKEFTTWLGELDRAVKL